MHASAHNVEMIDVEPKEGPGYHWVTITILTKNAEGVFGKVSLTLHINDPATFVINLAPTCEEFVNL